MKRKLTFSCCHNQINWDCANLDRKTIFNEVHRMAKIFEKSKLTSKSENNENYMYSNIAIQKKYFFRHPAQATWGALILWFGGGEEGGENVSFVLSILNITVLLEPLWALMSIANFFQKFLRVTDDRLNHRKVVLKWQLFVIIPWYTLSISQYSVKFEYLV